MKILHITKKYPNALGGDAVYVLNLENEQRKNSHDVFILTSNCKEIISKTGLYKFGLKDTAQNWDRIRFKRIISTLFFLFYLPFIIHKIKPDIIHVHSVELGCFASWWAKLFRIPTIFTYHAVLFPYKDINFIKRLFDFLFFSLGIFDKIIAVDVNSLSHFGNYYLRAVFIPPAVNPEEFCLNGTQTPSFKKQSSFNKIIRFLYVGRLEETKGLYNLLEATKLFMNYCDNFELYIVGDGSLRVKLENLSRKLNLNNIVKFLGPVSDRIKLVEIYHSADIFVLPSLRDFCPVVIFEAWAAGLALIATKVGSITTICQHYHNAYLISPNNIIMLAEALLELYSDNELRLNLARNGITTVKQRYTWEIISKQIQQLYTEILTQ